MASDATLIQNVRRIDPDSSGSSSANEHAVLFEADTLPSGVYIYTLRVGDFQSTRMLTMLK